MVIHSDSTLGALFSIFVILTAVGCVIASIVYLVEARFRSAIKAFGIAVTIVAGFVIATALLSAMSPQTVVNIGDSFCEDIWCIGIDKVDAVPQGSQVVYTLGVHIFSDANRVKTSAKGVQFYLFDENNHHFPLVPNTAFTPLDAPLDPGQRVQTTLTFVASADSQHLYLWGDAGRRTPAWVSWYFGSEHNILRKPTLIRVL